MFDIWEKQRDVVCFPRQSKMGLFSLLSTMALRLWIGVKALAAAGLVQFKEQNWDLLVTILSNLW